MTQREFQPLTRLGPLPDREFIFGSATVLGLAFVGLCSTLGLRSGVGLFLGEALAVAPMAFHFIREFRDD